LGKIADVRFTSDAPILGEEGDPETQKRIDAINTLVDNSPVTAGRVVNFHFGWVPSEINGEQHVSEAIFTAKHTGERKALPADAIYTAIGFTEAEAAAVKRDAHISEITDLETGRLAQGLYCVGWLRRGPRGTIPANRADAKMVSEAIIEDFENNQLEKVTV
jgi:ferredoxin--NADP+ reductase